MALPRKRRTVERPKPKYQHAINEAISAKTVQVVQDEGRPKEMSIDDARTLAEDQNLDLVEMNPNMNPPLCKIMDYGKFLYKKKKQEQDAKRSQKNVEMKTIRFGFRTGEHDLENKGRQARGFLEKGHIIKIQVVGRGRELAYREDAIEKVKKFIANLEDVATLDTPPKSTGNQIIAIIKPQK